MEHTIRILNVRELYHELGTYEFKVVLVRGTAQDPVIVRVVDSDGRQIAVVQRRWGRKVLCTMALDDTMPDGIGLILVEAVVSGELERASQKFWVCK